MIDAATHCNEIQQVRKQSWGDFFNRYENSTSLDTVIKDFNPSKIDKEFRSIPGSVIALMHQIEIVLLSTLFTKYCNHEESKLLQQNQRTRETLKLFTEEVERLKEHKVSYSDGTKYILYRLEVTDNDRLSEYMQKKFGHNLANLLTERKHTKNRNKIKKLNKNILIEWERIKADSIKLHYLIQYAKYILENNS